MGSEIWPEVSAWLVLMTVVVLTLLWLSVPRRPQGAPPGPYPFPVVGNLSYFLSDPRDGWGTLRHKYGDVYSLFMGHSLVIVLHSYDAIKKAFINNGDVTSDRPDMYVIQKIGQNKGLAGASGPEWREQRAFTVQTLHDFGLSRAAVESRIQEELNVFITEVDAKCGRPFDPSTLLHTAVSNVLCSVVFGRRFQHSDSAFTSCLEKIAENGGLIDATGALNIFPKLQYLPGDVTNIHRVLANYAEIHNFVRYQIAEHKHSLNREKPRDFIDAYLIKFKEQQKINPDTSFSEEQLTRVVTDLVVAGSETVASTLGWMLLFLSSHPHVEAKAQAELDGVLGRNNPPLLSTRGALPYLQAVLSETQRLADILPMGAPHAASRGFQLKGYDIPAGAILLPFLNGLHFDASWREPHSFRPSRFLDDKNKLKTTGNFLPFSVGPRKCIGESLAKTELFIFAATILKLYSFSLPLGESPPALRGKIGHAVSPPTFTVIARRR